MERTNPDSVNATQLNNRTLWVDGDSSFTPEDLYRRLLAGVTDNCYVTEITKDIAYYNSLAGDSKIKLKTEVGEVSNEWNIPQNYQTLDIDALVFDKLLKEVEGNEDSDYIKARYQRVLSELELFKKYKMIDLLRVVAYIVDTFRQNNVVWGTGRGSSCCSFVLYLLGLHDVDSVEYELDLAEFFR